MKPFRVIGILGGMGPIVGGNFHVQINRLAHERYGAEQDTEYPTIWHYQMPLDGFDETGFVDPDAVKLALIGGVQKLSQLADFITIPCNTVHLFYEAMLSESDVPILNILSETVRSVGEAKLTKVGILSSDSTNRLGLYEQACREQGIETISVDADDQRIINSLILKVMSGTNDQSDTERVTGYANGLIDQGAQGIVLGCTELPFLLPDHSAWFVPVFDSLSILAEAAVNRAYA